MENFPLHLLTLSGRCKLNSKVELFTTSDEIQTVILRNYYGKGARVQVTGDEGGPQPKEGGKPITCLSQIHDNMIIKNLETMGIFI